MRRRLNALRNPRSRLLVESTHEVSPPVSQIRTALAQSQIWQQPTCLGNTLQAVSVKIRFSYKFSTWIMRFPSTNDQLRLQSKGALLS